MRIVYECKYCGKEFEEEPLVIEGSVKEVLEHMEKRNTELSNQCECRKSLEEVHEQ